jgi:hypothetical protein
MTVKRPISRRALCLLACVLACAGCIRIVTLIAGWPGPGGVPIASGQSAAEPTAQTDASLPALDVTMIGSAPAEEPGETWGIGRLNSQEWATVHYTGAGWSLQPSMQDATGQPLLGFEPAGVAGPGGESTYAQAGRISEDGAGVLVGVVASGESGHGFRRVVLVRSPGGAFQETAPIPEQGAGALLNPSTESLYSEYRAPLIAAIKETDGTGGALVVPIKKGASGLENEVLHWDGSSWTRETIEIPKAVAAEGGFRVLGIGASSPTNAWLLAQLTSASKGVALFRRQEGPLGKYWAPVQPTPSAIAGEALKTPVVGEPGEEPFTLTGIGGTPTTKTQVLTVTSEGLWINGVRADDQATTTMFFRPEGAVQGKILASWCEAPAGAPACTYTLEQQLPTSAASRSFAWSDPSNPDGFGQRVITGLEEGVTLRLQGPTFERVLALGGSAAPDDVGGTRGAAFSNPDEGWLGNESLPVHLTLHPAPDRLQPYPVPFHYALTAIAPQPGVAVGALSSQALAVGDQGEVARYTPGEGWLPESLFGTGGQIARPRLRAVAWPTPTRAYAAGELGQMWLWRGETGLWEPDPATPPNFRGNLLDIAFDPANSSLGYAVGQQGVLLRYGKTWAQEPTCGEAAATSSSRCLPAEVAGASFTSVAFAGSEAIVAYRLFHPSANGKAAFYSGGLLVNNGSGWSIDQGAASALGASIPWAVAGLPDGGAALSATERGYAGGAPLILERNETTSAWMPTPDPYPNGETPGSLALFREAGQLRIIGSGGVPDTIPLEEVTQPPAGFPPALIQPYPIETGYVIRQTAIGWSDEEHDRNEVAAPPADYAHYDTVYQGDPTAAVLVDPTGAQGWAVGGFVDPEGGKGDTADISRYPAESTPPPGVGSASVAVNPEEATFAVGGGSQCAAPCADRADAGIGPDAWLSSALGLASRTEGVRAFFYAGPRLTSGETLGPPSGLALFGVPYQRELARYASLLSSSPIPSYAVPVSTDLAGGEAGECEFEHAFAGFAAPFGQGPASPELRPWARSEEKCATGAAGYYDLESNGSGGPVRAIVLDDSRGGDVHAAQRTWLALQLASARALARPAIVIGNADLGAQIAKGDGEAALLAQILVRDGASAYFYDAPEQNVHGVLQVGGESIPTFGSGTLGYVQQVSSEQQDFDGHSGFLLAQVNVAARNPANDRAPVTARLIPDIGELAMEAKEGTLLRRSQAALFAGLARRPRAGGVASGTSRKNESALYIPIPANCIGVSCASAILPEYTFSSSRTDIGDFVQPNLALSESHAVLLGAEGRPIHDPRSGLFCAYNAGTTNVTITAGGLSYSLAVTVQPGSVRRPCGTVPLKEQPSHSQSLGAPVPPPAPAPAGAAPAAVLPLPPPPPPIPLVVTPHPPIRPKPTPPPSFFAQPALPFVGLAFVPPPLPAPAEPTPPSGTSAVTSPVEAAQKEEEEEEATESVSNQALAYRAPEHEPTPLYLLGLVLLAAFAGASALKRPRRDGRKLRVAPATLSSMRTQRQMARSSRRRPW